jgi:hypothetical protein
VSRKRFVVLASVIGALALQLACSGSTTGGTSGGGTVPGYANCTSDDQCPLDRGCTLDAPKGDGYCSPLCDSNAECPGKYSCPSLTQERGGDCDEMGRHRGRGICEMFGSSFGPNTCGAADAGRGTVIDSDGGTGG